MSKRKTNGLFKCAAFTLLIALVLSMFSPMVSSDIAYAKTRKKTEKIAEKKNKTKDISTDLKKALDIKEKMAKGKYTPKSGYMESVKATDSTYNPSTPPSTTDTSAPSNPDPAPVYTPDPVYVLISVAPVTEILYVGKGVSESEMINRFPKTTTLNLTADGSPTSITAEITWTEAYREKIDDHKKKILYSGRVAVPYYVTNPNDVSTEFFLKAYMTDNIDISKAEILFKPEKGKTERPKSFEYTGKKICPEVEVEFEKAILPESSYKVTYGENINAGKGTVTITAYEDSDYAGSVTREFEITKIKQLNALYGSTKAFVYNPNMTSNGEVSFKLFLNDDPKKVKISKTDYSSRYLNDSEKDISANPSQAAKKITLDQDGVIHIADGIDCGDYTLSITTSDRKNFENPQTVFTVRVGTAQQAKGWVLCPDAPRQQNERDITYDPKGGEFYIVKPDGTEELFTTDPLMDYYNADTVNDDPYKLRVGDDPKKYDIIVRKGNQDPSKGKVLKFVGWYTDDTCKNPYEGEAVTSGKNETLYARYKYDSDLTVAKKIYDKYHNSAPFNLGAKCSSAITYRSTNTRICTVDKKGKVIITGIGKATIKVEAKENKDYKAKTISVIINVTVKGPTLGGASMPSEKLLNVTWAKVSKLGGYEVQISEKKTFPGSDTRTRKVKYDKTDVRFTVKSGSTYYCRIRGFYEKNKTKYYSAWSKKKIYKTA